MSKALLKPVTALNSKAKSAYIVNRLVAKEVDPAVTKAASLHALQTRFNLTEKQARKALGLDR